MSDKVIAKGYFKTPVAIIDHMVEKLFEKNNPNPTDSVLDAGCGPGDFIEGIIRWCEKHDSPLPNIKGVELDPKFVARAKQKFQKIPEITIEQRDYLVSRNEKFDFIISNPPYVPITKLSEIEKRLYRPLYKTAKGRFDLYLLFFEKSLKSLSKNARLVFITPEKYTYVKTAQPLRLLLTHMQVKEIEFFQEDAFSGLTTYPTITIVENSKPQNEVKIIYRDSTIKYVSLPKKGESWLPVINGIKNDKLKQTLEDICIRISCGVATGADKIFVHKIDSMDPNLEIYAYPTIPGKELVYDQVLPDIKYKMLVPYDENGKLIPLNKLGPLEKYLKKPEIMKRLKERSCARKKPWHAFHETPPMKFLFRPKILCRDISARPAFWLDKDGIFLPRHTIYYIIPKNVSQINKIYEYLESTEAKDWLMKNCQRAANDYIRLQSSVLKKLPIPDKLYNTIYKTNVGVESMEPYPFSNAVKTYWKIRSMQAKSQKERGVTDTGTRAMVTGGQHMNGFSDKIVELLVASGIPASDVYVKNKRELPGFFRPHKGWDILVISRKKLLAVIELKSQVGPSFGNNFNNRTEEALGSALDFWTAYRENAFGTSPPWLGFLFLLEDSTASQKSRNVREPHFKVFPEFKNTSYAQRYELLCRKLVLERHYNSTCLLLSNPKNADKKENYIEPSNDLSAAQFLRQLLNHVNLHSPIKPTKIDQY